MKFKDYLKHEKELEKIYLLYNQIKPKEFYGSVLYLGMGTCLIPSLQSEKVERTVIVEYNEEVINHNRNKGVLRDDWEVVNENIYKFKTDEVFDFIFIDIWCKPIDETTLNYIMNKFNKNISDTNNFRYLKSVIRRKYN